MCILFHSITIYSRYIDIYRYSRWLDWARFLTRSTVAIFTDEKPVLGRGFFTQFGKILFTSTVSFRCHSKSLPGSGSGILIQFWGMPQLPLSEKMEVRITCFCLETEVCLTLGFRRQNNFHWHHLVCFQTIIGFHWNHFTILTLHCNGFIMALSKKVLTDLFWNGFTIITSYLWLHCNDFIVRSWTSNESLLPLKS